ncbi:MAG TPA: hypothetical protein VNT32_15535 [Thermoleophilaceae bacterium]|nr:hypothetical protein [Thermoleophilaceae bacterium]
MATAETIHAPPLGEAGEPCRACGHPLAADQRYCLNCGLRRAEARLPFMEILRGEGPLPAVVPAAPVRPPAPHGALALAGAAALAFGVLIGALATAGDPPPPRVAQAPAPVVNVTTPAGGGAAAPTPEAFASDWPEGTTGYTVVLERLPKDDTEPAAVAAAKSEAQSSGAPDVGALDGDEYPSAGAGEYVVYSGVFDSKKAARKSQRRLRREFLEAEVVRVSTKARASAGEKDSGKAAEVSKDELRELQKLSGEEQQKRSAKLPDKTKTEGRPPAKDGADPGAGSEEQVIE